MTPEQELQLIAAILASGDVHTPRKMGLLPEFLMHVPAQQALNVIYKYSEHPHTQGMVPGVALLHAHAIQFNTIYNPAVGDLPSLCQAAKTNQIRRIILKGNQEIALTVNQDPLQAFQRLQALSFDKDLIGLTSSGFGSGFATGYAATVNEYKATVSTGGVVGLPTPFPTLTHNIKGWQKGGFYVIYAPPKNYKSWLALACLVTLYMAGYRVLVVSTEMTHAQLNERILCMIQGIDYNAFLDRTLPDHIVQDLEDDVEAFAARAATDLLHWTPSCLGDQAINEVRGKIQEANYDGKLAAVLWDGHYRSAPSAEWNDMYPFIQRTRQLSLDPSTGQVPILITTGEGSKKGEVSYKAIEFEADVLMHLLKLDKGKASLTIKAIRKGRGCKLFLDVNFHNSSIVETLAQQEDDDDYAQIGAGFG